MQTLLERRAAHDGGDSLYHTLSESLYGSEEHQLVQEVIEGSIEILHIATHLHEPGALRNAPSRTLQRIVSAFVFLLKAMSLSVSASKLNVALSTMASTIAALRQSTMNDIQLSARYADPLDMCVEGLREKFVPCRPSKTLRQESGTAVSQMKTGEHGGTRVFQGADFFDRSDDWEMDWLQLPVYQSLLTTDPLDPYGLSWLDDKSLDFLQTLDD